MIVETLIVGLLQTNCYVIGDEETGQGAVIDPGGHAERILSAVRQVGEKLCAELCVRYVIDTHAHFDHTLENGRLMHGLTRLQDTPPELVAHVQAAPVLAAGGGAGWFGFPSTPSPAPDRLVHDGDVLTGDVLFQRGVGRPDLPGGDWATLMDSIRKRLFALPDDTRVYPGHGPCTMIGVEKRSNPFLG
jgi:hydroxyacylglutathione hydrolase